MFNVLVVFSGPILVFGVVVLFWFTLWFSPCRLYGLGLCLELDRVPNLGLNLGSGSRRLSLASFCFLSGLAPFCLVQLCSIWLWRILSLSILMSCPLPVLFCPAPFLS